PDAVHGRAPAAAAGPGRGAEALTELLRSRGYEPFAEEPGLLRLRNCPFGDVATHHRELVCGLNLALVRGFLSALGAGPGRAVLAPEDDGCCVAIAAEAR